jgi:hypothetical protein
MIPADQGSAAGYPFTVADVVLSDPLRNCRDDPRHRAAFRAQGKYFRRFDDAGSFADPAELLAAGRALDQLGTSWSGNRTNVA